MEFFRGKPQDVTTLFYHAMGRQATHFVSKIDAILALNARQIDARQLPQAQEQFFFQREFRGDGLDILDGTAAIRNGGDIGRGVMDIRPSLRTRKRMRTRPKAQIRLSTPVFQVCWK